MTEETEHEKEFIAFFMTNRHRLVRAVTGLSGDRDLAEDIAQEVMINIRRCWGRYQRPEILMIQMAKQELGRRSRRLLPHQLDPLDDRLREVDDRNQIPAADSHLDGFDPDGIIMTALRQLPDRQKEVIVLAVLCDLDNQTTAEILGISESSVSTHKKRGLTRLEALLSSSPGSAAGQTVGGA